VKPNFSCQGEFGEGRIREDALYLPRFLGMEKALQKPNVLDHRAARDPPKEEH